MLTRRTSISLIATLPSVVVLPAVFRGHAWASPAGDRASAFIKAMGVKLVAAIDTSTSMEQRRQMLADIINGDVDVDGVARFCLGRYWRIATPAQQQQYLKLFRDMMIVNIASKLGQYKGVTFTLGTTQDREGGELVNTVVTRPNNPPANTQWLVVNATTDPKIIDLIAEGTSLRITERDDYASFLTQHGNNVDALLEGLRRQVSQNG